MYLVGSDHPNKSRVLEILPSLINNKEILITSVETLQEIIHRYLALKELGYLNLAYEAMENLAESFLGLDKKDLDLAKTFVDLKTGLSSRDCIHLAVMKNNGCKKIWTFDKGFDLISGIKRIF
jgi:predicted nucleic acid-binding protein